MSVEASTESSEDRFHRFFDSAIREQLTSVNAYRKHTLRSILLWWVLLIPSVFAAGYGLVLLDLSKSWDDFLGPLWFISLLVSIAIPFYTYYDPYRKSFKTTLVAPLIRAFRDGLVYSPEKAIDRSEFNGSGMFRERTLTEFKGEDRVEGIVGKTAFRFSEVEANNVVETTNSKGGSKSTTHKIFAGLFYVADFNKHFNGTTYIFPDRAQRLLGSLGQALQSDKTPYGELVKLEDPEFERHFVVYSSSQIEARYILSSALMQRITALRVRTGKKMRIGLAGSRLYVAISSGKNHFEPRLFRSVHRKLFREFWDVLELFVAIVEELNLNTRIWTKA